MPITNYDFMMKYNFHQDVIPQYSKVKYINCTYHSCLIEDYNTKKRKWIMRCDIYPLCPKDEYDRYGEWSYNEDFNNIAKRYKYL